MKRSSLLLIPLLAACGGGDAESTLKGESDGNRDSRESTATRDRAEPAEIIGLTGLYEARAERGRAQMCMISPSGGAASFGLVTERPGGAGCGGAGEAVREGSTLRLTMSGDESCVIQAQIAGREVRFPAKVGEGCDYYCGPGASLAGTILEKKGDSREDAMQARDLAGDPLCS